MRISLPRSLLFFISPHVWISAAKSALQGPGLQPKAKSYSNSDIRPPQHFGNLKDKRFLCLNVFFPFLDPCTPAGLCLAFPDNCWDVASPGWDTGLESVSHLSVLASFHTPQKNDFLQRPVPLRLHFRKHLRSVDRASVLPWLPWGAAVQKPSLQMPPSKSAAFVVPWHHPPPTIITVPQLGSLR